MPTTTGLATSFIQFSRPSASGGGATVTLSNGKIGWAGHNILANSENFDAAYWSKLGVTVTANTTVAPNGTTTADTAASSSSVSTTTGVFTNISTLGVGVGYSMSVFVKAGTSSIAWLSGDTGQSYGVFNLSTGAVIASGDCTPQIVSVGSGWYKITLANLTVSTLYFIVGGKDSYTSGHPWANGTWTSGNTIFIWGAHLYRSDLGSMQQNPAMPAGMGSYYPTTPRNLLGFTEDFSNAYWNKSGGLLAFGSGSVSNAIVAPNGLQTADKLVEDTSTGNHSVYVNTPPATVANTPYTASVYAKAGERSWIYVRCDSGTAGGVYFNLATGTKGTEESGRVGTITSVGNGWYRCSVTATLSGTSGYGSVHLATADNARSYAGDGVSGAYLWGAQLSDSASLDAYSPVYGAAVTSAAYYAPRLDFDSSGVAKGLLVEEARTNVLQHSNAITTSPWQMLNTATASQNAIGPDGAANSAWTLTDSDAAARGGYYQSYTVTNNSASHTASGYFKKTTSAASFPAFQANIGGGSVPVIGGFTLNTDTGVATAYDTNSGTVSAIVTNCGDYWRIAVTVTNNTTGNTTLNVIISAAVNTTGGAAWSNATTGSCVFYGAQLEANASFATSYIPTGSATATRAADLASSWLSAVPHNASEGSYVVAFTSITSDNNMDVLSITSGSADDRIYSTCGPGEHLVVSAGGVGQANIDAGTFTAGAVNKIGAAWAANNFAAVINGGSVVTDTSGTVPIVNRMFIGNYNGIGAQLNGHIRQITYLPRRISNAELAARSA